MIEGKNIVKRFGDREVLKNVSIAFKPGVTNLIIGQSGSGKTVLMKCLVGLHEVDRGQVLYNGRDFSAMTIRQRQSIRQELGMLFQGGALFDSLNVIENVMFPLNMYTNFSRAEKMKRVEFCLDRVNLSHAGKLRPSELSGGMIKRVAIARAISNSPKYLFCDEPNSGLDPQTSTLIDNLISEITLEFNITTVINTHDMNSVLEIGQQICFIYKGELWWEGNNEEVLRTNNTELNEFIFSTELTKRLKKSI
ncbi:MAG TPA: ATP-binding cassette domain-containing protein [Bacteroidales bacterium]|jgi:phospholipid/cholesterol/gamma-HCH transport system ATP-binding protein|nr:ATP-binding cassette domain-containing protein [Bacteroidales bacterium]